MFSVTSALAENVFCQRRTGKNKQYVFMKGDKVYKGPYKMEKIQHIFDISKKTKEWQTPYIVHPFSQTENSDEGPFITFPNIALDYPIQCELHTESFTGRKYNVLIRSGVVKLGDALTSLDWIGPHIPWITLAMCHLFALEVGDTGLANILVDLQKKTVYVIDYEEHRDKIREDEFFYFSGRPAKDKAAVWLRYALPYYPVIANKLTELAKSELNAAIVLRLNQAIHLLRHYSGQVVATVQPVTVATVQPVIVEQLTLQVAQLQIQPKNIGKMSYKGPFGGSTTYSGYSLDIMKSALQKYIRRNIPYKALVAAFELYRMAELEKGRAAQSNMYNRLAVISAEDIGPANLPLAIVVISQINLATSEARGSQIEKDLTTRDPATLGAMVQLMAGSEKTRIMSHFYRAYITPEGRELAKTAGFIVDDTFTQEDLQYLQDPKRRNWWLPNDSVQIRPYAEIFYRRLAQQAPSVLAFVWLGYYMKATEGLKVQTRKRRSDPMTVIWEMLSTLLPPEVHDTLEKAYFKQSEDRPFLMTAVTAALYRTPYSRFDLTNSIQNWRSSPILQNLLNGVEGTFQVDEYVIDKHTKEGRAKGATRKEFVEEGAKIEPASAFYYSEQLERIYKM